MSTVTGVSAADETPGPDGKKPLQGDQASTGRVGDRLFGGAATLSGVVVIVIVSLIGIFLVVQAVPALMDNSANFFTSRVWAPGGEQPAFGILEFLWTTVTASTHRDDAGGARRRRRGALPHAVRAAVDAQPRRRPRRPARRRALDRLRPLGPR